MVAVENAARPVEAMFGAKSDDGVRQQVGQVSVGADRRVVELQYERHGSSSTRASAVDEPGVGGSTLPVASGGCPPGPAASSRPSACAHRTVRPRRALTDASYRYRIRRVFRRSPRQFARAM
ncbi:unnamed protein product [Colias eurytheme]|nr:unnamed protein product [Colias eurytheme]